jgi:hypothetical protein
MSDQAATQDRAIVLRPPTVSFASYSRSCRMGPTASFIPRAPLRLRRERNEEAGAIHFSSSLGVNRCSGTF